jgi:hypothetical protein
MGSGSSVFISMLRDDTAARPKRWLCLLYDQLNLDLNPWKDEPPESTGKIKPVFYGEPRWAKLLVLT